MDKLLQGDNIRLRPLEPSDIDRLYQWENDSDIWQVSHTTSPFSKYILAMYIKSSDKDIYETKQLRLMIETNEGTTVGAIDLFEFDPFHRRVGVGILVYAPELRKQGYANESLRLAKEYCFEHLGLHQIWANITEDNTASINLFEGLGFKKYGHRKDWIRIGNSYKDEMMYQLFR